MRIVKDDDYHCWVYFAETTLEGKHVLCGVRFVIAPDSFVMIHNLTPTRTMMKKTHIALNPLKKVITVSFFGGISFYQLF